MHHRNARRRSRAARLAAIAFVLSCVGGAAIAQVNAPGAPGAPAAAPGRPARACPATAQEIRQPTDCVCTAVAVETEAQVWGVDIYSDDSSICRAARHAGVVSPGGGTVRVMPRGPQPSFPGSERHGITTLSYGGFPRSFSVAASEAQTGVDLNQCPATFQVYRAGGGALSCICTAEQTAQGTVWGTDVYTHDSSVCTAAVHVGRITLASGGTVTIEMRPGQASYLGSTRNGITSNSYGAWGCSVAVLP